MKLWLHSIAAFVGLMVAAGIVVLVFSQADREGSSQAGNAPSVQSSDGSKTRSDNTGCQPSGDIPGVVTPEGMQRAQKVLPSIFDQNQREVTISDAKQRLWFQRLQAALGLCGDEIDMYPNRVAGTATYPSATPDLAIAQYSYGFLTQAFSPPLARPIVEIDIARGDDASKHIKISQRFWLGFQREMDAFGYPPTVGGLRRYCRQIRCSPKEIQLTGW